MDHSSTAHAETQKLYEKCQQQIQLLQGQLEDEQHLHDECRAQLELQERRANSLNSEVEELKVTLDQAERLRKEAESDLNEAGENVVELTAANTTLNEAKVKLETELAGLHVSAEVVKTLSTFEKLHKCAKADKCF